MLLPFTTETRRAPAVVTGGTRLVPELSVLRVRLPSGGFVRCHPSGVVVETETEGQRLAIIDVTSIAQLAAVASVLTIWLVFRSRGDRRKDVSR
jgi:hypothetical protein